MSKDLEQAIKGLTLAVSQLTVAQHMTAGNQGQSHEDELDREEDARIAMLEGIIVKIDEELIAQKCFTLESLFRGDVRKIINQILMSNAG